ncbi:branched-chain amino acid ABC transporter permease [Enterovirga sp.]|jgi:branched-chain amino acid transport system permease protein|uniref:branched-chain amino acid ABC transporter permease n=1 Tax=Enterovirga sp. TaxID=2026350 RepID=UPI0026060B16|nr:branched-chain amino acid ABC transporter permease [Enterovirga sp.]MDB5592026.1 branched-chain amino acid transporter permease [Enterovirga sp.]
MGSSFAFLWGQLVLGLVNGAFYSLLSLGLALIFGMMGVINFAHGALYMCGAFSAWMLLNYLGIGYWGALLLVPILLFALGAGIESTLLRPLYKIDPVYGLLLTVGLVLIIESIFRLAYGISGRPYPIPASLKGVINLGFMFLPVYRLWVISLSLVLCVAVIVLVEYTKFGAYLRATMENPTLLGAFGLDVARIRSLTFGLGVGLAGLAGVLAAPMLQVSPLMGAHLIIVSFAIVVIGGIGSIKGTVVTGMSIGIIEGLCKTVYSPAAGIVVFVVMALVLLVRPTGLFGRS